jgi:hypothetical protein
MMEDTSKLYIVWIGNDVDPARRLCLEVVVCHSLVCRTALIQLDECEHVSLQTIRERTINEHGRLINRDSWR